MFDLEEGHNIGYIMLSSVFESNRHQACTTFALYDSCSCVCSAPYFLLHRLPLQMGACFTLIFEGCPLKINATATWVNPLTKGLWHPTLFIGSFIHSFEVTLYLQRK